MGIIEICESGTADCYVEQSGALLSSSLGAFSSVVPLLFGALVLWGGVILARWILNGCSFRNKRGGRRF